MEGRDRSLVEVPDDGFDAAATPAGRRIAAAPPSLPRFVGFAHAGPLDRAVRVESFRDFARTFSDPDRPSGGPHVDGGRLAHAIRGYFSNGGQACLVVRAAGTPGTGTLADHRGGPQHPAGLALLLPLDGTAAIAAPDAHGLAGGTADATELHRAMVAAAEATTGGIAILDPPDGLDALAASEWRRGAAVRSPAAAVYFPWLGVADPVSGGVENVPPCGHILGAWARVDRRVGAHRAPTGEALLGIEDVAAELEAADQRMLNRSGINCVRAWPGPEPRLWGARTLSDDPASRYLHHRRLLAHIAASIAEGTRWDADEDDAERTLQKIRAGTMAYLAGAWRRGALHGATPGQAFYVSCEAEGDSLAIEVGLAIRQPADFHVLRIVQRPV